MKRTVILLFSLVLIPLMGCQKKYCWKCMTSSHTRITGADIATTESTKVTNATLCDETDADIQALEKPTTSFRQEGVIYISTDATTTCNK